MSVRPTLYTALMEEQLGLPVTGEGWGDGAVRVEMIVLSEADIAALLPMADAIAVVEGAMKEVSAGNADLPLRSIMDVGKPNMMGIMPGAFLPGAQSTEPATASSWSACFRAIRTPAIPRTRARSCCSNRSMVPPSP